MPRNKNAGFGDVKVTTPFTTSRTTMILFDIGTEATMGQLPDQHFTILIPQNPQLRKICESASKW